MTSTVIEPGVNWPFSTLAPGTVMGRGILKISPLEDSKRVVATKFCGSELKLLKTVISPLAFLTTSSSPVAGKSLEASALKDRNWPGIRLMDASVSATLVETFTGNSKSSFCFWGFKITWALPKKEKRTTKRTAAAEERKIKLKVLELGRIDFLRPCSPDSLFSQILSSFCTLLSADRGALFLDDFALAMVKSAKLRCSEFSTSSTELGLKFGVEAKSLDSTASSLTAKFSSSFSSNSSSCSGSSGSGIISSSVFLATTFLAFGC